MVIKLFEQGARVDEGKYIYHVVTEDGMDDDFPPVKDEFAVGSVWEDTSESGGDVMTFKWVLIEDEDNEGEVLWNMVDPMTLDTDETLYDVSGVQHVYVEIAENDGVLDEGQA